jgi:FkbM family methyltransferase
MMTIRGHSFIAAPIGPRSTVIDLGANNGDFTRGMWKTFGSRCIAVEPTPTLAERLRSIRDIEVCDCAVGDRDQVADLHIFSNSEKSNLSGRSDESETEVAKVRVITFEHLLKEAAIDRVDLLKVDIEGAEVMLFDSIPDYVLERINQISVEYHDFCGLVSTEEIRRIRLRLHSAGFYEICFGPGYFNTLYVRRGAPKAGAMRRLYVKHIVKNARSLWHATRPMLGISPTVH